jgi:nucleoside-diphosphate-sugar epimerase
MVHERRPQRSFLRSAREEYGDRDMNVFVAGGSGTIGVPLVRALKAAGHQVTALTRSAARRDEFWGWGVSVAVADALDRDALIEAVRAARPTHVIHQLTALPKDAPRRARDLTPTNRLRIDGTRNLLDAAVAAGARRFVAGSFAPLSPRGAVAADPKDEAAAAVQSMESQVLDATERGVLQGVVLRYGLFYGLEAPSTVAMIEMVRKRRLPVVRGDAGQLPVIHVDDAVRATVLALEAARPGGVYEIVDDQPVSLTEFVEALAKYTGSPAPLKVPAWLPRLIAPYMSRMTSMRLPLSNQAAKEDLGWRPKYPTMRDGLAHMFRRAA